MIEADSINRVRVKGKEEPVSLYELKAITWPERLEVPAVDVRRSPRSQVDLPLRFQLVKNKQLLPQIQRGRILDLGYNGMLARLPSELLVFTEIAFTLTHHITSDESSTLYAKVLKAQASDGGFLTNLEFSAVGTPGHEAVKHYVDQLLWAR
jgi:adenylate cyclase